MIKTIGIDLGKSVFHMIGMDYAGSVVLKKRCFRSQLGEFMANFPACVVAMEARCGSHYLGQKLAAQGHSGRLIPAQFVRPFVKSNKNDFVDAEAIAEAVQCPTMRFVTLKSEDQLDFQALHRVRDRLVSRRTAVINQLRAYLLERGFAIQKGRRYLNTNWGHVIAQAELSVSARMLRLLMQLRQEWQILEEQIEHLGNEIESIARQDEDCRRLVQIPGVGPWSQQRWFRRLGRGQASVKDATSQLGSVWYRDSTRREVNLDYWE